MEASVINGKRKLRVLELKAFGSVVDALRAQGALTENKYEVLNNLAVVLNVDEERGRSEMRRAVNDQTLTSIAKIINGHETEYTWRVQSTRKIPFTPMVASESVYTSLANNIARIVSGCNEEFAEKSNPSPSMEEIRKANIQRNIEEFAEKKVFDSLLGKIDFDEDTISKELDKIEYYAHNQFSHPKEYVNMISNLENFVEMNTEQSERREEIRKSPADFVSVPEQNVAVNKNVIKLSSTKPVNAKSVIEVLPEESTKERSVKRKVSVEKRAANEPIKRSEQQENTILPAVVEEPTRLVNEPIKRSRQENTVVPVVVEEPVRMVRKAKLNAKRWNPKTQTLESPSNKMTTIDNPAVGAVVKPKPPVRNKTLKDDVRRKVITSVDGDTPEKMVCSTKGGRRATRLSWSRKRRTPVKNSEDVGSMWENYPEMFDVDVPTVVSDSKENTQKIVTNVEESKNTPSDEVKHRSPSPVQKYLSASKLNSSSENDWLQNMDMLSTSRHINILRKKVYTKGAPIEPSKKFSEKFPSVEVSKCVSTEDTNCDFESKTKVTKSILEAVSTIKTSSVVESEENTLSKSVELVHDTLTTDNSQSKTITNCDSVMEVEDSVVSSTINTQVKMTAEHIPSAIEIEVVPNPISDAREREISCDSTSNSEDPTRRSTSVISEEGRTDFKMSVDEHEINVSSDQHPKRVKILTPNCGNNIPRPLLGCNVRHPVPRTHVAKPLHSPGRIKILPPGCKKNISEILLGSSVRVRNRKSFSPDLASLQANYTSVHENADEAEVETNTPSSPIEVVAESPNENSAFVEELLLSASDDEYSSDSSTNSVHESRDVANAPNDTSSAESKGPNIRIESDVRLDNSNSVFLSITLEKDQSYGATKVKTKGTTNTISVINEDWKELDSIASDEIHPVRQNDKEDNTNKIVRKSTTSTSESPKPIIGGVLSTMIGLPPWTPKVIEANGTMCCHIMSSESLKNYRSENNVSSILIDEPSTLSRERSACADDVKANTKIREGLSPRS